MSDEYNTIQYNKLYLKSENIKHYNTSSNELLPHGVPPGMFSMVIVEISAESVKACSFHQRKSIPDTEIIYSTFFRYNRIIVDFRTDLHKMKIKHRIIDEYAPKRCFFD
jgi:hypothetical protein